MNSNSFELAQKKAIFDSMDAATAEDDAYDEDNNEIALFLKTSKTCHPLPPTRSEPNRSFGLRNATSDIKIPSSDDNELTSSQPTTVPSDNAPVKPPAEELPSPKRGRKRKRQEAALPDALQVFRGLVFCR